MPPLPDLFLTAGGRRESGIETLLAEDAILQYERILRGERALDTQEGADEVRQVKGEPHGVGGGVSRAEIRMEGIGTPPEQRTHGDKRVPLLDELCLGRLGQSQPIVEHLGQINVQVDGVVPFQSGAGLGSGKDPAAQEQPGCACSGANGTGIGSRRGEKGTAAMYSFR